MRGSASPFALRLGTWLLLQLLLLAIGAMELRLYARHPDPPSSLALHIMLAGQIALAGLLADFLFVDGITSIALVIATWPMLALAGMLAEAPVIVVAGGILHSTLWLGALAGVCVALRCGFSSQSSSSVAWAGILFSLYSIGGVTLYYWRLESTGRAMGAWFGPIVTSLCCLNNRSPMGLSSLTAPFLVLLTTVVVRKKWDCTG